jgi:hypothetical protein
MNELNLSFARSSMSVVFDRCTTAEINSYPIVRNQHLGIT